MANKRTRIPDILVGSTIGMSDAARRLKTRLPHRPVRWCYGLPLTTDPTRFYPDPWFSTPAQVAAWKVALDAARYENEYAKPGRVGDAHSEPWGLGITIFPESRDWPGYWDVGGPRIVQEDP